MRERFFTEYRDKDYRMPRSTREAYGYEPTLWVVVEEDGLLKRLGNFIKSVLGRKNHVGS